MGERCQLRTNGANHVFVEILAQCGESVRAHEVGSATFSLLPGAWLAFNKCVGERPDGTLVSDSHGVVPASPSPENCSTFNIHFLISSYMNTMYLD